ncbi:WAT1-related protein [Actinidia chinensis var. chinensis]|uniref:WAT1-related protein n=1 Tax=Actinidia chinensis var. chinensis TaxID=1590841 RepID=A0A2R6QMW6_ACTCC|nr:WAT1-related protein [Actinidia chinensis var. chinensis]
MTSCDEWKPVIAMVAIDFGFAIVNILLKKVTDAGMDHLVFITYRQSIATIFLAPIGYLSERNSRPKLTFGTLCHLFLSAIVGASLTQYFFLLGIQYTSATFSCAFVNMVPVITFMMALPFGLESVKCEHQRQWRKSQSAWCTSVPRSSAKRKERWTIGSIALVAGTLLWSSWFLLQSKIVKRYPYRNLSAWVLKGKMEIFSVMYAGIVGSGLCYVGMSWCVRKRGPLFTAAFSPLVQIMAAMFDIPILHEQLHLGSLLGSIIVIAGLYILLWGKNKELLQTCDTKISQENEEV